MGSLESGLDSGAAPQGRDVYRGDTVNRIVVDDGGTALAFDLVTREFDGTVFGLASGAIDAFGVWPAMPADVPQPSEPDGGPVFVEAGEDDGTTIYSRPGKDPADGFAVAPGTQITDPAAANPGWTWWEPLP